MLDETVLLLYKNTSCVARGDDVRRFRAVSVLKLIRMLPEFVPRRGRLKQRGAARWAPFLARSRFRVARGVWGVEEVKRRGVPTTPAVPYSFQYFSRRSLTPCSLTRGPVSVGMFRDRSDPLTDDLRKASSLSARTAKRFTETSHGRSK